MEKSGTGREFDRQQLYKTSSFNYISSGQPGGKASGLVRMKSVLDEHFPGNEYQGIHVDIPRTTIILTDIFDEFMEENHLFDVAYSDMSDERIAHAFQNAALPPTIVGDLMELIKNMNMPLAVRSSSMLEDAIYEPFAGVYGTKMIPNNQPDIKTRFNKLVEAVKYVYSSLYFKEAKDYFKAVGKDIGDEKMAVIIQEVVGTRIGDRYYPAFSGVGRSYNFYPTGNSKPEDGVVNLSLGLGKNIVDGGKTWHYSPKYPTSPPPYNSVGDLLKQTQTSFWAINMGKITEYDPIKEAEYLIYPSLKEAEEDGILKYLCSTYEVASDRIYSGMSGKGPRILNFSPVLKSSYLPYNEVICKIMKICEEEIGAKVEIEFAVSLDPKDRKKAKLGFLQVRPMVVSEDFVDFDIDDEDQNNIFAYSKNVMGNGINEDIKDIVFVKPETFNAFKTREIARDVATVNARLVDASVPYMLIGFGRWGTSDPWLGIPVNWSQIAGARVIVESTLPEMNPDLSQGSHFFHNITSFRILYYSINESKNEMLDWKYLKNLETIQETEYVRHVRLKSRVRAVVDGRKGEGAILKMAIDDKNINELVDSLRERAKELNCLYKAEEILNDYKKNLDAVFYNLIDIIPPGWQYSNQCVVRITFEGRSYQPAGFLETQWVQSADIKIDGQDLGKIEVFYVNIVSSINLDPFLPEEQRLLNTIAERLSNFISHKKFTQTIHQWQMAKETLETNNKKDWKVIIELVKRTDMNLYLRISRKMMNYLCWVGVEEARSLLQTFSGGKNETDLESIYETNKPMDRKNIDSIITFSDTTFSIASQNISDGTILSNLQKWIQEDKLNFLVLTLENLATSHNDIQNAITRFHHLNLERIEISDYTRINLNVLLVLRFFTDQLEFINIAKNYVHIKDFYYLIQHIIFPNNGHGKLGGKSAGIFLASNILQNSEECKEIASEIKVPKTWYITSDTMHQFLYYNNLEEIIEQKYKSIEQIREEYPNIIQIFKNSHFPPEIIKGLSLALDDFGQRPIIVRSSSLLEDRVGAAFSGKYKSLFLANQGTKSERLHNLIDAVAEVYASVFSPDPIEYRKERGLLDFHEEMAIIIQEVVGRKIGKYYLPAFAGVAFSNNEFRWSPRIKREDGLVRLVPGLGTRAVDRLAQDFPILAAPGQPNLRVNVTADEVFHYSPKKADVINLEKNTFETIDLLELLKTEGHQYPIVDKLVSAYGDNMLTYKSRFNLDFEEDDLVITFNGLMDKTDFLKRMNTILNTLREKMGIPVDIEFAHDGRDLYLLQCRAQSHSTDNVPSSIPKDIPEKDIVFTAKKFVSNGLLPDITHIVYVDPDMYNSIETIDRLKAVGRAMGRLNAILPKRKFILMGPGRWGSRGDIKLGVSVTYSDINNTSMLIEIAKKKGNYVPELSFGTHFFQDLVESSIKYLPLYPGEEDIIFHERFLSRSKNILGHLVPDFAHLEDVVKVIDVADVTGGKILKILMNADLDEALAFLSSDKSDERIFLLDQEEKPTMSKEDHWQWRMGMAEHIAEKLDAKRFGVEGLYLIGSTKNANAGPSSDIDFIIHFSGDDNQKNDLEMWLEGWSMSLSHLNYLKTGYQTDGLLDVHFVTDEDIENKTSFAVKINAITDPAKKLKIGG